jgi:hypothetical protein
MTLMQVHHSISQLWHIHCWALHRCVEPAVLGLQPPCTCLRSSAPLLPSFQQLAALAAVGVVTQGVRCSMRSTAGAALLLQAVVPTQGVAVRAGRDTPSGCVCLSELSV